jgi:hypothetical protein|tara:strand:- start:2571 stop:2915 length:345 start_codon:yes stop_codon:yes gene_type:complete
MINFEWDVSNCEVYPNKDGLSDVVHKVNYKLKGIDDTNLDSEEVNYFAEVRGRVYLDTSDLSNFIPWSELTPAVVQAWVEANIGPENVLELKNQIEAKISDKINPSSITKVLSD